jgi:HAD superfamily hydrolase (TIGR01509 family)
VLQVVRRRIAGFVSDVDGIVADTDDLHHRGWQKFLAPFGIDLPLAEWAKGVGMGDLEHAQVLKATFSIPMDVEAIARGAHDAQLKELEHLDGPKAGYLELLQRLSGRGFKIALASASSRAEIEKTLERTKVRSFFSYVASATEAGGKVAAYREAASAIGLPPEECFALEDSPPGAKAAKEARLYCVVIPNPLASGADWSMADEVHATIPLFLKRGAVFR